MAQDTVSLIMRHTEGKIVGLCMAYFLARFCYTAAYSAFAPVALPDLVELSIALLAAGAGLYWLLRISPNLLGTPALQAWQQPAVFRTYVVLLALSAILDAFVTLLR